MREAVVLTIPFDPNSGQSAVMQVFIDGSTRIESLGNKRFAFPDGGNW
jgi:hypothetical protein